MFHMDPYLMGTAGFQAEGNQAVPVFLVNDLVMCDCRLAVFKVHGPFYNGAGHAGKRRVDRTGVRCDNPSYDSKIFPVDPVSAYHVGEDAGADQMLGYHGKARGITVQPVAAAEDKGLSLLLVIPGQCIGHGTGIMIQGRMNRHPCRLVDYDEVVVFIYNVKGQLDGWNFSGTVGFADADLQAVACGKLLAHIVMAAIDHNAFGHPLDFRQILAGIALPS